MRRLNYLNSNPYPKSPFDYRHYYAVGPVSSVSLVLQLPPDVLTFPLQHVSVRQFAPVELVQLFAPLQLFGLFRLRDVLIQPSLPFQLQQFQPDSRDQQKLKQNYLKSQVSRGIFFNFYPKIKKIC